MIRVLMACTLLGLGAEAAKADIFNVYLNKTKLGVLALSDRGGTSTLQATLTDTPLSVFDGNYTAESTLKGNEHRFESISISSRKTRQIAVRFDGNRAGETLVTPASEMTPLSDPTRVPSGVSDPVRVMATLVAAPKCPQELTFYDGRRVIALTPTEATKDATSETCAMSYKVVAGPGHLSPLKIAKAKVTLTYAENPRSLTQFTVGSGIFLVTFKRIP